MTRTTHDESKNTLQTTYQNEIAWYQNHILGLQAALLSFAFIWPIDTISTRLRFYKKPIFQGNVSKSVGNYCDAISPNQTYTGIKPLLNSFLNKGIYWGFSYFVIAGALTLPAQTTLQNWFLKTGDIKEKDVVLVKAFAGWIVAFMQLILIHPIDSMKVKAQKTPDIFGNSMGNYFRNKQPELRRGTGVVALGSISHFIAWHAKLHTEIFLQDKMDHSTLKTILPAIVFSITHMLLAYPINTIKTWAQGDSEFMPRHKSFFEKAKRTASLTADHVKTLGPSVLYRGFFSRGGMHITSFALNMCLYDTFRKKSIN